MRARAVHLMMTFSLCLGNRRMSVCACASQRKVSEMTIMTLSSRLPSTSFCNLTASMYPALYCSSAILKVFAVAILSEMATLIAATFCSRGRPPMPTPVSLTDVLPVNPPRRPRTTVPPETNERGVMNRSITSIYAVTVVEARAYMTGSDEA